MPSFRTSGGLDDPVVVDGDVGFLGVNNRLPVWQLGTGMLSLSENGRIDGDWQPRRGVDVVADGSLAVGSPLRLPFWLIDEPGGEVVTAASRVGEVVTLTVPGHGLPIGGNELASRIINPSGADNSIFFETGIPGELGNAISIQYIESPATPETLVSVNESAIAVYYGVKSNMIISGVVTAGVNGDHYYSGISNDHPDYSGDTSGINWFSGSWVIQSAGYTAFIISEAETPEGLTGWTIVMGSGQPVITAGNATAQQVMNAVNGDVVASSLVTALPSGAATGEVSPIGPLFLQGGSGGEAYLGLEGVGGSPTVDPEGNYPMTPTDANTLVYDIPGAVGSESYTVSGSTVVLARLDDSAGSQVLGSCKFSDPSSSNDESVFLAYGGLVKRVFLSDGTVTDIDLPGSETLDGEIDMIQAFDKVYIFRSGVVAMEWSLGDTSFALVPDGAYVQPQTFEVTGTNFTVSDGLATVTVPSNLTVANNATITIADATGPSFIPFIRKTFTAFNATATTFQFYIQVKDFATIGGTTISLGRQVSLGGGYIHQPAFPWAVYFQRRLWGPYEYTDNGSGFDARDIHDELVASDVLDGDTYDPIENQFRITGGTADYIVALQPFYEDALIVLNRNSVHGVFGTVGSLADTSVRELTREVGCLARKSVASQGPFIFFLSDDGVYMLEFFNDYNLRGTQEPLSKDIQPYIDRISESLAGGSVGVYFNNRYWLAVPLDSAPKQGDATGNNAILVYNLKNTAWESVDTFGDPQFQITNLIIATGEDRNDLYAITADGGIHILDNQDSDFDRIATNPVTGAENFPISAQMATRGYLNGTTGRKKFREFAVQFKAGTAQSDIGITFTTEDPDSTSGEQMASSLNLGAFFDPNDTADIRGRTGPLRGFNGILRIRRVIGRGSVRGTKISANGTSGSNLTFN